MLSIYEAPTNLPLPAFARLAGKSRDQINRDMKSRRLHAATLQIRTCVQVLSCGGDGNQAGYEREG